jgi:hypothetical protein
VPRCCSTSSASGRRPACRHERSSATSSKRVRIARRHQACVPVPAPTRRVLLLHA